MVKFAVWGKGKLYVIPTLFGMTFAFASILLLLFDQVAYDHFNRFIPDAFFHNGLESVAIYTLVSASLVTMVTITFSIMMVVLTIYGSQLSSKSLQDFLSKKITLKILGYFIGALIFSLIQLAFADNTEDLMGIGAIVCIFILMVGVIILVYFIHYISKSIQINRYIDDIVKESVLLLEESKKHVYSSVYIEGGDIKDYEESLTGDSWDIISEKPGYLQYYDTKRLIDIAKEFNVRIFCDILIGEYILPGELFVKVYNYNEQVENTILKKKILDAIIIGDEPDLFKDISTGSKRLIDVALKALSPGVNDPTTAISCIQNIGYLLNEIAKGLEVNVYLDNAGEVRIVIRSISFNRLLFNHFYQIKHYGSQDMFVLEAIIAAITKIAKDSNAEIKQQVWEFAKYLIEDIDLKSYHVIEQRMLSERLFQLSRATSSAHEFGRWDLL